MGQWGDGKGDFLEEYDTEDAPEDSYSNLNSEVHVPHAPSGGSSTTLGVYK